MSIWSICPADVQDWLKREHKRLLLLSSWMMIHVSPNHVYCRVPTRPTGLFPASRTYLLLMLKVAPDCLKEFGCRVWQGVSGFVAAGRFKS